jgi:Ca-activated chloride channel family protein
MNQKIVRVVVAVTPLLLIRSGLIVAQQTTPSVAMVVVLDRSVSMAGTKLSLAKEATKTSLELLGARDSFGVLIFDRKFEWALKIAPVQNKDQMRNTIDGILATGNTNVYPALREAYEQLKAASAQRKHILLLSDARTPSANFHSLEADMLKDRITLSTIAVTAAADRQLLQDMANWGGGRTYYVDNPTALPQIFRDETELTIGRSPQ